MLQATGYQRSAFNARSIYIETRGAKWQACSQNLTALHASLPSSSSSNNNSPRVDGHPAEPHRVPSPAPFSAVYSLHSINDFATLTLGPSLTSSSPAPPLLCRVRHTPNNLLAHSLAFSLAAATRARAHSSAQCLVRCTSKAANEKHKIFNEQVGGQMKRSKLNLENI